MNTFSTVISLFSQYSGSISAEHGIGQQKTGAMRLCRSPAELAVMRAVKRALDPKNTMNPGKVLPWEEGPPDPLESTPIS
jgi:FAD/FMN-containing dehydrogenase